MARSLFAGRPGDFVASLFSIGRRQLFASPVDANGDPANVVLTVWDAPDGTQLTDLLAADGATPITQVVVPANTVQIPEFYGPDGVNVAVYLRDPDGDFQRIDARPDVLAEQIAADADRAETARDEAEAFGGTNAEQVRTMMATPGNPVRNELTASTADAISGTTSSGLTPKQAVDQRAAVAAGFASAYLPAPKTDFAALWDFGANPVGTLSVSILPDGRSVGSTTLDPIAEFNAVSTAYSAPGTEVWCDINTGNDTTGNGTQGNPYASWNKGQTVINTAGLPGKLHIIGGTYLGANRPSQGSVEPTVDTVVVLHGPTVASAGGSTTADTTFTLDQMYPRSWRITQSSCAGVLRLDQETRDGHRVELTMVPGRSLTKGATDTTKPARVTNASGGDPNGVGFTSTDLGAGISGTGIPSGAIIASIQTANAVFIVQGSTQTQRTVTLIQGNTTISGTFTSADVGQVIYGPGIPAQGASGSVPNTIVSQTGTAAVIANAPTSSGVVVAGTATAAAVTVTDTSNTVALTLTGSPAQVNDRPGSWVNNGVWTEFNLGDATVPTTSNVRSLRASGDVLRATKLVNYMLTGSDNTASLAVEGGINAGVNISPSDFSPGKKLLIFNVPVSARYSAVSGSSTGRGWSINSWYGRVIALNPDGSANATDGFNAHNANTRTVSVTTTNASTAITGTFDAAMDGVTITGTGIPANATMTYVDATHATLSAAATAAGTVTATVGAPKRGLRIFTANRRGIDNGRPGQSSCQGGTIHEDVLWIDLCPTDERNHGGGIRNIGTTWSWIIAPNAFDDRGDKVLSAAGLVDPVALRFDDQAVAHIDRPNIKGPGHMLGIVTTSQSTALTRDQLPTRNRSYAQPGTTQGTY